MNEEMVQQMMAAAERLAAATETLDRVLGKLDAQQEMLNAKVDRIEPKSYRICLDPVKFHATRRI